MSLDKDKKTLEGSTKESGVKKTKDIAQQDILDLSRDEEIQRMKDRYGETKDSFVKWMRASDDYGNKVKNMTDAEIIEFANTEKPLKEYLAKQNQSTVEKQKSIKNPESYSKPEQQWSFDQKTYEKIVKEKWWPAWWEYAMNARKQAPATNEKETKPEIKKAEEKAPDKKPEAPKEDSKPVEKPAESKKEADKTPDKKPDGKEKEIKKADKKDVWDKKSKKSFRKTTGDVITYLPKQAWKGTKALAKWTWNASKWTAHQTANLIKYPLRTARSTVKFGRQYMDHGFSKVRREKNQAAYFSKRKWEQGKK